ncbi:MAG: zinc-binding dehydrogenase [Synergistaceae bacterium]|jgi:threonine dehydrogenase-like Zn-dependent dehydrogenase|nr:zinc-binding dehydrogenase [Synergistaceae bacterium]
MEKMKALAVTKDYKLEIVEIPTPRIANDCVLTKTLSCGVCNGTDTKLLHGTFKAYENYPTLLGHEAIGEVVEVGENVKQWKIGDRITLPYLEMGSDGKYPGSEFYSAWSAYAEYTVARDWQAMAELGNGPGTPGFWDGYYTQKILPVDIDPVYGAMINTFREVLAACKNFGFGSGVSLVIFGAGPVGLTFTKFAKLLGARTVIVADILEDKRAEAQNAGADHFINSKQTDVVDAVKTILPEGTDYVLDAVGVNDLINTSMGLVKDNGQICVYGISPKLDMNINWAPAPYNWGVKFLQFPVKAQEAAAHDQIITWVRMGVLKLEDYVSHIIPFSDILTAFDMIERKEPVRKIVIKY